jgi:hypothetical protein
MDGEMWLTKNIISQSVIITIIAMKISLDGGSLAMAENKQTPSNLSGEKLRKNSDLVTLSWWSRGGEPGPGYTSDKLDIHIENNHAIGTYIRARFNTNYNPPFLSEQFTSSIPEQFFRDLLTALEREKIYDQHFASEDRSKLADAIKDTISLSVAGRSQQKTLYASEKSELATSKAVRDRIAKYLYDNGKKTIRSQQIK